MATVSKEQIAEKLVKWITEKKIFSQRLIGERYYAIYSKIRSGEYFSTLHPSIYASRKDVADEFNSLFGAGAIMSTKTALKRHKEFPNRNALNTACMNGRLIKLGEMKGISIYVADASDDADVADAHRAETAASAAGYTETEERIADGKNEE